MPYFRLAAAYLAGLCLPAPGALVVVALLSIAPRARKFDFGLAPALGLVAVLGLLDRAPRIPPLPSGGLHVRAEGWIAAAPQGDARFSQTLFEIQAADVPGWHRRRVHLAARRSLPPYGTRLAVQGRLRAPQPPRNFATGGERDWLASTGEVAVLEADSLTSLAGNAGPAWRRAIVEPLRARLGAGLRATLAPREASLLEALLVGRRDGLDATTRAQWAAIGVNHILSISGMHVALVAGAVLALCGSPHRRRGVAALVVTVWVYAAVGGLGATVLRATLMTTWVAVAVHLGRSRRPFAALGLASLGLVLQAPERRHDLGLQLSCLSTGGLLATAPLLADFGARLAARGRGGRCLAWVLGSAGLGIAAQLATLPLQLSRFGTLSWCAPVANLVMVPLSDAALVLALVGAPLGLACDAVGRPLVVLAGGLTWVGCELAAWASGVTETRWFVPAGPVSVVAAAMLAAGLLGAAVAAGDGRRRNALAGVAIAGVGSVALVVALVCPSVPTWQFEALDVGQGDALVLRVGPATWLVDTGDAHPTDNGSRVVVPHLRRAGVRHLRGLVLTHPHRDHCGGAASVLGAIAVDTLYVAACSRADSHYVVLQHAFPALPVRTLAAGASIALGVGYQATVLWPESTDVLASGANGCSVVLWARGAGHPDLLTMGDLEADGETRVLERWGAELRAAAPGLQVLKAGHHGSDTSSSPAWLAAVQPEFVVLSVGTTNRYGHPGRNTLAALAACGARIVRTDRGGAVRILQRGETLWLERPGERACAVAAAPVDAVAEPP